MVGREMKYKELTAWKESMDLVLLDFCLLLAIKDIKGAANCQLSATN